MVRLFFAFEGVDFEEVAACFEFGKKGALIGLREIHDWRFLSDLIGEYAMCRAFVDGEVIELRGLDVDLVDLEGLVEGREELALCVCGEGGEGEWLETDLVAALLGGFVGADAQEVAFWGKGAFDQAGGIGGMRGGDHVSGFIFEGAADRESAVTLDAVVSVFWEIELVDVKGFFTEEAFVDLPGLEGTHPNFLIGDFIRCIGLITSKIKEVLARLKQSTKDTGAVRLAEGGVVPPRGSCFLKDALEVAFAGGLDLDHPRGGEVKAEAVSIEDAFDVACGGSARAEGYVDLFLPSDAIQLDAERTDSIGADFEDVGSAG